MNLTAHVTEAIKRKFHNHDYRLTNQYVFDTDWESDFFSVTNSGYAYEVEVKVSQSDFRADFEKWKHKLFKCYKTGWLIRGRNWPRKVFDQSLQLWVEMNTLNMQETSKMRCPNKFYFACPVGVIKLEDIPVYAGLIYVDDYGNCTTIKEAPFIHKNKMEIQRKSMTGVLLGKYYWKSINLQNELDAKIKYIHRLQFEIEDLKKQKEDCHI